MSSNVSTPTNLFLTSIPPKNAESQEIWSYLHDGLEVIMNLTPGEELSFASYTNLYSTVYNYYTASVKRRTSELYDDVGTYFAKHSKQTVQESESLHGVELLRCYAKQWERYTRNVNYASRIFSYMDRYFVKKERDVGRKTIYPFHKLAFIQWKQCFIMPLQRNDTKFTNALLRLIMQDRDGELIDRALIKKILDSLVSLGIDNGDPNKECLDVYKEHFEILFIIETERHYRKESLMIHDENYIPEYLRKVEDWLQEEGDRAGRYLHASTRAGLITLCEHVLIREPAKVICDRFQLLLDGDKYEELQRIYTLMSRIPEGHSHLRERFEAHVKQAGLSAISKLACKDESDNADVLLEIQRKYTEIVNDCFNGDTEFSESLGKTYQELVNYRVTTDTSTGSSEPTTDHVDMSLRENSDVAPTEDDYLLI